MRSFSGRSAKPVLNLDRRIERLVDAAEGGDEAVAGGLEDAAEMPLDAGSTTSSKAARKFA